MMSKGRDPHAEPADARARYEQRLMRIGRRLQSLGQVLEQAPARIVAKGFPSDASITGDRPVVIEMDELRALFDASNEENVGILLREYHEVLRAKGDGGESAR
jgi:hypothetical protein